MAAMQPRESAAYYGLLTVSIAFSVLAIVTLLPNGANVRPNGLGYRSVCAFAPAAPALCGLLAGATCTLRNRLLSRKAASTRYQPLFVPAGVAVLLLALAAVFGIRYGVTQSRFAALAATTQARGVSLAGLHDGTRTATITEGEVSATVSVSVSAGAIQDISLAAGRNVDKALAAEIFDRVKKAGSTSVDAMSGATVSSNVLLDAVETAALGK
jgi:uncharacterized protein with FMN-binding domain